MSLHESDPSDVDDDLPDEMNYIQPKIATPIARSEYSETEVEVVSVSSLRTPQVE